MFTVGIHTILLLSGITAILHSSIFFATTVMTLVVAVVSMIGKLPGMDFMTMTVDWDFGIALGFILIIIIETLKLVIFRFFNKVHGVILNTSNQSNSTFLSDWLSLFTIRHKSYELDYGNAIFWKTIGNGLYWILCVAVLILFYYIQYLAKLNWIDYFWIFLLTGLAFIVPFFAYVIAFVINLWDIFGMKIKIDNAKIMRLFSSLVYFLQIPILGLFLMTTYVFLSPVFTPIPTFATEIVSGIISISAYLILSVMIMITWAFCFYGVNGFAKITNNVNGFDYGIIPSNVNGVKN
jgi:hypothetical protein